MNRVPGGAGRNLQAHQAAKAAIKSRRPELPVGLSLAVIDDVAADDAGIPVRDRKRAAVYEFWLEVAREDDFVGVQNYERLIYGADGGIATADDAVRCEFIETSIAQLLAAVDDGLPVLGYCHWTLMDNFEWVSGYGSHLGLAAVDRQALARTPKRSAQVYGDPVARYRADAVAAPVGSARD